MYFFIANRYILKDFTNINNNIIFVILVRKRELFFYYREASNQYSGETHLNNALSEKNKNQTLFSVKNLLGVDMR